MRITPAFELSPAQQNDPAKIDKVARNEREKILAGLKASVATVELAVVGAFRTRSEGRARTSTTCAYGIGCTT
jgi:hypothetical protein